MERTVQRVFVGLAIMLLVGLAVAGTVDLERERSGESEDRGPANRWGDGLGGRSDRWIELLWRGACCVYRYAKP